MRKAVALVCERGRVGVDGGQGHGVTPILVFHTG
jgi:hypothetical protein